MAWFKRHGRDLPWRRDVTPYAIWLSEVMLQQTTVAMVCRTIERFVERFPTIAALAAADEHEVLRLWEGLGYYRRARQLHAAAKQVVAEHGGAFPREFAAVRALPGIGRYTAGAILSIAFDQPGPILEANTIRVWAGCWPTTATRSPGRPRNCSGRRPTAILPRRGGRAINQALMELGAQVRAARTALRRVSRRGAVPRAAAGARARMPRPQGRRAADGRARGRRRRAAPRPRARPAL